MRSAGALWILFREQRGDHLCITPQQVFHSRPAAGPLLRSAGAPWKLFREQRRPTHASSLAGSHTCAARLHRLAAAMQSDFPPDRHSLFQIRSLARISMTAHALDCCNKEQQPVLALLSPGQQRSLEWCQQARDAAPSGHRRPQGPRRPRCR